MFKELHTCLFTARQPLLQTTFAITFYMKRKNSIISCQLGPQYTGKTGYALLIVVPKYRIVI